MNIIKGTTRLLTKAITVRPVSSFADAWKDRDEAA